MAAFGPAGWGADMAGDWIKMRNDLADDPAIIGMAARLNVDEFSIVGRLHRFWSWADRHSRDGHATGVTKAWIDRYVQCDGFADALETCAWLVVENNGVTIPNFDRHNGESAKKRGLATDRKRKQRSVTNSSTDMSRNERDESVTREEKRREDKYSVPNGTGADAPKSPEQMTKDELWSAGKSLLMAADMPKAQCGSFVGKLVKDYTDAVVIEAVRAAVVARPADPAQYLKAACQRMAGQRIAPNKQEAIEARNRAVAAEWLAGEGVICN